jgi:hypothetical protein
MMSQGMRRRALRPSFVVTFALGAAAIAGGCSSNSGNGFSGTLINDGGCPAELPESGAPCQLSQAGPCYYSSCETAACEGTWVLSPSGCNPPPPPTPPPFSDAAPDGSDAGLDGEGQDGGHD